MPFVCVESILCFVRLGRGMLFAVILTSLVGEALFYVELDEGIFLEGLEPWRGKDLGMLSTQTRLIWTLIWTSKSCDFGCCVFVVHLCCPLQCPNSGQCGQRNLPRDAVVS